MDLLVNNLERYLYEVTGQDIRVAPMNHGNLPYFLTRQYALYHLVIGNTAFTAVFLLGEVGFKPAQFIKHMQQIPGVDIDELCVVAQSLPGYVRKRLIEKGISFVVPKVQMYLPRMGMELRPRSRVKKTMKTDKFSPATQVVLIHWLLGRIKDSITPLELSSQLHYSTMTMSRVLDELESIESIQVKRVGKVRLLTFLDEPKIIWQQVLPKLRNPISHTVRIQVRDLQRYDLQQSTLPTGITALSTYSMINEPTYPEYAISRDVWKDLKEKEVELIPVEYPGTCLLQIWCYNPAVLEVNGEVDPFSLYLSLQDEDDERVEMALEQLLEKRAW